LGTPRTLVEPLLNETPADAESALIAYASTLGRLHGATAGQSQRYDEIYRELSKHNTGSKSAGRPDVQPFVSQLVLLGIDPGEAAIRDVERAQASLHEPGPFHAFIHGDPCPDNILLTDDGVVLIDFEFAHFGHALSDAAYGRMMFPTCWCCNRLPGSIVDRMETAYRAGLARFVPQASDDGLFHAELTNACAGWVIGALAWHLKGTLAQDDEWGIATVRSRVLSRLEAFVKTSEEYGSLPHLRDCAMRVEAELKRRWPETDTLPLYPSFRS
jgi:hypothetical protein